MGLSAADADPRLPCQVVVDRRPQVHRLRGATPARSARRARLRAASARCSAPTEAITLYLAAVDPATGPRPRALVHRQPPRWGRTRPPARPSARCCARGRPHGRRAAGDRPGRRDGAAQRPAHGDRGRPRAGRRRRRDVAEGTSIWTLDDSGHVLLDAPRPGIYQTDDLLTAAGGPRRRGSPAAQVRVSAAVPAEGEGARASVARPGAPRALSTVRPRRGCSRASATPRPRARSPLVGRLPQRHVVLLRARQTSRYARRMIAPSLSLTSSSSQRKCWRFWTHSK